VEGQPPSRYFLVRSGLLSESTNIGIKFSLINQVGVDYAQAKRRAELNPPMPKASKLF
jgi:hypothetical protein